jgi:glycosyltransferase involved in cell wall biosynthesis
MIPSNGENPKTKAMKVGISVVNLRARSDLSYANRLVEYLGSSATKREFILIGRQGHENCFGPAPQNFSYVFYKLHDPISTKNNPRAAELLNETLIDTGCDLLVEFGSGATPGISLPSVSIINSFKMFGTRDLQSGPSSSQRRLKLINKSSASSLKQSQGIIFSSPYLRDEFSRILPLDHKRRTSIYMGSSAPRKQDDSRLLSNYGINKRYIISLISSAGMRESLRLLKAYGQAFEKDSNAPDLVLIGTEETPGDVCNMLEVIHKSPLHSRIKYIGIIPDEDLYVLLTSAHLLVFPYEIFNCADVLVTAMECGCTILCANRQSSVDIACEAALYYDPQNWGDLAFKMKLIADDTGLSNFLRSQSEIRDCQPVS